MSVLAGGDGLRLGRRHWRPGADRVAFFGMAGEKLEDAIGCLEVVFVAEEDNIVPGAIVEAGPAVPRLGPEGEAAAGAIPEPEIASKDGSRYGQAQDDGNSRHREIQWPLRDIYPALIAEEKDDERGD